MMVPSSLQLSARSCGDDSEVLRRPATLKRVELTPEARPQIAFPFSGSAASHHMSPRFWKPLLRINHFIY
jgi:hypothetical protein